MQDFGVGKGGGEYLQHCQHGKFVVFEHNIPFHARYMDLYPVQG